ncbi:MAG: efflux RND transporter periplasmic adaptor subunit [Bauldia sp.]|nr:efflux RND transporter periplasmic adaptor subunit [Bauldia sp.]
MKAVATIFLRGLALAIPLALGVLSIAFSGMLKEAPAAGERQRPPTPVRVITMDPVEVLPRVSGFGTVTPVREWRAVARIDGQVAETSEDLASGNLFPQDALILRIDDSDLKLELAEVDAQLASLDVKDSTIRASLEIARADLELSRNELDRQEELASRGVATQTQLDEARRQELSARAKLADIENQLVLNAAERDVLKAQRATVERSLSFAEIHAPYDLRINDVSAEVGQYVSRGQTLVTAEDSAAVEIAAYFPVGRIGPLLRGMADGASVMDLGARVSMPAPGHSVVWQAKVDRVGDEIDARTQSSVVVVRVDDPLGKAQPGRRPPLRRNMFVEVTLVAPTYEALVAPREAVRDGMALVVTGEGTLEKRKVSLGIEMDDLVVVTGGIEPGEKLVITDPSIAVPGMMVKPVEDAAAKAALAVQAKGMDGNQQAGAGSGKKRETQE